VTRLALVLLSGSVLLGGLGAANNVSLSVLERRRELALLRAIGASRHQVRALVTVESMVLCGLAGVLGVALGTIAGVAGVGLAPAEFAATAQVPWLQLGALVLGACAIGALAAAIPARASVRREILEDLDAP
jgi:putative ABC transport system permease protein